MMENMTRKRYAGLAAVLALIVGYGNQASALDSADHPNMQELQRPDFLPAKPPEHFELPPVTIPAQAAPRDVLAGQVLQRVQFHGNRVIAAEELEKVAGPWLGKSVGVADLESLRLELTRHYIGKGYINSGALLASTALAEGGVVTFDIVEGRLTDIRTGGLDGLDPEYVKAKLLPDPDAAFNVDRLRENFQLLLDDPLFTRINAQLAPGQKPGESLLNLEMQRARPYHLTVQLNNYRPSSIGEETLGVTGGVRNLTGRGDALEGYVQKPLEGDQAYRSGFTWQMPLNYAGTGLTLQADDGESMVIEEPLRAINIRSLLTSWEAGLSQTLLDRLNHRLAIGVNYLSRVNKTYLDGVPFSFVAGEPDGVTRAKTVKFWQEYTYRSERQVLALRSTFAHTRNNLQQIAGLPTNVQPADSYSMWLGQAQYVHKLTDEGTQFITRLVVQDTSHKLLSMDGMSIGGVATVRGFRENQMIRDKGYVGNFELDIPVMKNSDSHSVNLIPFLDYGRGHNVGDTAQTISSGGMAVRWRWNDLTLDLALARRLTKPDEMQFGKHTLQDQGIHLQLSYKM